MSDRELEKTAKLFMIQGVQDWGQSDEERREATANYLKAAGFNVKPSGEVVFGGMVTSFSGPDAVAAREWLVTTLLDMPRGKYEHEVSHLVAAAKARGEPS